MSCKMCAFDVLLSTTLRRGPACFFGEKRAQRVELHCSIVCVDGYSGCCDQFQHIIYRRKIERNCLRRTAFYLLERALPVERFYFTNGGVTSRPSCTQCFPYHPSCNHRPSTNRTAHFSQVPSDAHAPEVDLTGAAKPTGAADASRSKAAAPELKSIRWNEERDIALLTRCT